MKAAAFLSALLALLTGALLWQTQQRGADQARWQTLAEAMRKNTVALAQLRASTDDAHSILAAIRASEQQRAAEGESRREKLRQAIKNDSCADTVVPAAVSDGLQQRRAAAAYPALPAVAGQPVSADAGARTGNPGQLGRDSHLERPAD